MEVLMVDVIISGGGLVGGVMAIALADAGMKVTVIDREPLANLQNPAQDGRTTAINYASQQLMVNLGLWERMEPYAEPIWQIKALEGESPWSVHFDHSRIGHHPMGYIVENAYLRQAIIERALNIASLSWLPETHIIHNQAEKNYRVVTLNTGEKIAVPLVIVAEGKNSPTRETLGIKVTKLPYGQKGLVFSMIHEKPHQGQAWEVFYPQGPLAFLPAKSEQGNRSGIVWTLPEDQADHWYGQDSEAIERHLHQQFPFYGSLKLTGKRWIFPITAQYAHNFIGHRVALIGDAAHVCHYVAGQGVNLGWRDAAVLRDLLLCQQKLGLDLGSETMLRQYQKQRRVDSLLMVGSTDLTVRLFSNRSSILHFLRSAGLGITNQISPIKKVFMKYAMGIAGHKPELMVKNS
jgi:2-octaprenyl-6-methoxyphenol hydroxylase